MKVQRKVKKNKQRNIRAKNGMQWEECLYCQGDEIKHRRGQKAHVKWSSVGRRCRQEKKEPKSPHASPCSFIVYKNFSHTNEVLGIRSAILKTKPLRRDFEQRFL